jgi:hypothetical protein
MESRGVATGVPYVVKAPVGGPRPDAPVVVAYHLLDAPHTEVALAAAVPLDGLDAWRVYFGLPLSGSRQPEGGLEPLLQEGDPVLNVHAPVAFGARNEFPAAFAEVREHFGIAESVPLGVLGGSMGGAAAQLVAAEVPGVRAAVLINPVVRLHDAIDGIVAAMGATYAWSPASGQVAERLDFVARAGELAGVSLRYITGADDLRDAIIAPVERIVAELAERGATADHHVVPDMAHALAEEPGIEAAPQTRHAAEVDRLAVEWFRRYLIATAAS